MKNMKKTIVCIVVGIFLIATVLPTVYAEELEGTIKAEILPNWIGIIAPVINLTENQTIELDVNGSEDDFSINQTLRINLEKIGDFNRTVPFILPRYLIVQAFVLQKELLPVQTILRGKARKSFLLNEPLIGADENMSTPNVDISLNYPLENGTLSENLTIHVFAVGIFPAVSNENKRLSVYRLIMLK